TSLAALPFFALPAFSASRFCLEAEGGILSDDSVVDLVWWSCVGDDAQTRRDTFGGGLKKKKVSKESSSL
ncbi:hypothetical protein OFB65_26625, partial [Escherichia coli]|nr:hypothetical protein [Escherichia coli]